MNLKNFLVFIIVFLSLWIGIWFYIWSWKNYTTDDNSIQTISSASSYYKDFEIEFSDLNNYKNQNLNYVQNQVSLPLSKIVFSGWKLILIAPHWEFDISKIVWSSLIYPDQVKDLGGYYFSANWKNFHIWKNNIELIQGDYKILANNLAQNSGWVIFWAKKISDVPLENYKLEWNILFDKNNKFYFSNDWEKVFSIQTWASIQYIWWSTYSIDWENFILDEINNNLIISKIGDSNFMCLDLFLCKKWTNIFALFFSQDKLVHYWAKNWQLLQWVNWNNFEYLWILNNVRYYYNWNNIFIIKQNRKYRKLEKLSNKSKTNFFNSCKWVNNSICKKLDRFSSWNS